MRALADIANLLDEDAVEGGQLAYLYYCGGGSLLAHLTKLRKKQLAMNEANAVVVTAQIGSALQHCHALGVAHRDVKPANVLFDGRRWRLCDFGFAVQAREQKLREQLGTLVYCAPEILSGKSAYVGWAVDVWAFGAMLYEMRVGRTCFVAADEPTLRLRISNGFKGGTDGFPWLPAMSADCRNLISALLLKAPPDKRLSAQQVLEHRWVLAHCAPGGDNTTSDDAAAAAAAHSEDDAGVAGGDAANEANETSDDIATASAAKFAAAAEVHSEVPAIAEDEPGQQPHWWCDVAAEGCLRPEQPTHACQYDPEDRCWVHPDGTYMACEACYAAGNAEHADVLRLVLETSELAAFAC